MAPLWAALMVERMAALSVSTRVATRVAPKGGCSVVCSVFPWAVELAALLEFSSAVPMAFSSVATTADLSADRKAAPTA